MRRSEWSWLATERALGGRRSFEIGSIGMARNGPAVEAACAGRKCWLNSASYAAAEGSPSNQWPGSTCSPSASYSATRDGNSSASSVTSTSMVPAADSRVSVSSFCRSHTLDRPPEPETPAYLNRTSYDLDLLATSFVTHLPFTGLQLSVPCLGMRGAVAAAAGLGVGTSAAAGPCGVRRFGGRVSLPPVSTPISCAGERLPRLPARTTSVHRDCCTPAYVACSSGAGTGCTSGAGGGEGRTSGGVSSGCASGPGRGVGAGLTPRF